MSTSNQDGCFAGGLRSWGSPTIGDKIVTYRFFLRDGPNTTTTTKENCSDATPERHLMTHQMKIFVVSLLCRRGIWCAIRGYPKMKNGAPRDELKNGRGVVVGPSLISVWGNFFSRGDRKGVHSQGVRVIKCHRLFLVYLWSNATQKQLPPGFL